MREDIREKREELTEEAKAVRQLGGLANSLRHSGLQLRQQDRGALASYSYLVANQIDRASGYLEERNLDDLQEATP